MYQITLFIASEMLHSTKNETSDTNNTILAFASRSHSTSSQKVKLNLSLLL